MTCAGLTKAHHQDEVIGLGEVMTSQPGFNISMRLLTA
jgi:hypothetical protein